MAEPTPPPVTLIIPNFNGAHLLRANLPAVLAAAARYPGGGTVVVVDDGSRDASLALLRDRFPTVRLVWHASNRGFAAAVHSGVAAAATELLVLLNSDVRPDPDFLAPLARHFTRPELFAVSPLVVDEDGRCNPVSWRCYRIRRGRLRPVRWHFDPDQAQPRPSLFASGGSVMLRKSMFLALGGFAPIFQPFYSEDFDLGLRAWRRGWPTLFEPASRVIHGESGSIKENTARARIKAIRIRNHFLLEWIHLPRRELLLHLLPGYLVQSLGRLVTGDWAYFQGLGAALPRLPETLKLRAELNHSAVLDFHTVRAAVERSSLPHSPSPDRTP